jgi:hypothetical protein
MFVFKRFKTGYKYENEENLYAVFNCLHQKITVCKRLKHQLKHSRIR